MSSPKSYIYGRHPVLEALKRRPRDVQRVYVSSGGQATRIGDVLAAARAQGVQVVEVTKHSIGEMVGDVSHQGVVAMVEAFAYSEVETMLDLANERDEAPLLVVLDSITDPQNLGAIVRAAHALGSHGIIIAKDRACEVTPAVVRASAGATAHTHIARVTNLRRCLDELKGAGLWAIGTVADGGRPPAQMDFLQPSVLVIGAEGKGLRPLVRKTCDMLAQIPMPGQLGSLNAAVAAGICLYEAQRQRAVARE